jgi:hypothetical protein
MTIKVALAGAGAFGTKHLDGMLKVCWVVVLRTDMRIGNVAKLHPVALKVNNNL